MLKERLQEGDARLRIQMPMLPLELEMLNRLSKTQPRQVLC